MQPASRKPSVAHRTELRGVSLIVTDREMQAIIAATSQDRRGLLGCWQKLEKRRTKTVKSAGPIGSDGRRTFTTLNGGYAQPQDTPSECPLLLEESSSEVHH